MEGLTAVKNRVFISTNCIPKPTVKEQFRAIFGAKDYTLFLLEFHPFTKVNPLKILFQEL